LRCPPLRHEQGDEWQVAPVIKVREGPCHPVLLAPRRSNSGKGRPQDPAPQPLVVPAGQLHQVLGVRDVKLVTGASGLALKDEMLG